jgi:hypothetical protein
MTSVSTQRRSQHYKDLRTPSLSLTGLVEVVTRAGTPKAKRVAAIKSRPADQPQPDFYKALREGLIDIHEKGIGR